MTPRNTLRIQMVKNYTPYENPVLPVLNEGEEPALEEWLARCLVDLGYAVLR